MKNLFLIGGVSGSGKSVALTALEDAGFCAISNLPLSLLEPTARALVASDARPLAVTLNGETRADYSQIDSIFANLKAIGWNVEAVFLDARNETLVQRFSETRRRHPFTDEHKALNEAIEEERSALAPLRDRSFVFDTSSLKPAQLRSWIKNFVGADASRLLLLFESFGFKHGVPLDADLVFDARCLPNPYYKKELAPLTGLDRPVIEFLEAAPKVAQMRDDIFQFVSKWLPDYVMDNRNYLTLAVGCTGGRHRSVYLVEQLAAMFREKYQVSVRHRELK
jgi:UPF0042 nucleotide-binding protein